MKFVETNRKRSAHNLPLPQPARLPARMPSPRRIFMAMVLVASSLVVPTGTTSADTMPPETLYATLVTTPVAAPVGLHAVQEPDSTVVAPQTASVESTEQPDSVDASQAANGDTATAQQDTTGVASLRSCLENLRSCVADVQSSISKGHPIVSQVVAGLILFAVVLELISRALRYGRKKGKRRGWVPHVLSIAIIVVIGWRLGAAVVELYAAMALVGLGIGSLLRLLCNRIWPPKADPSEENTMPERVKAWRKREEELDNDVKAFMRAFRKHVDFINSERMINMVSESDPTPSSDTPPSK